MPSTVPNEKITSEKLHNRNCFAYLKRLRMDDYVLTKLRALDKTLAEQLGNLTTLPDAPVPQGAYADLYTRFFSVVEENIAEMDKQANSPEKREEFNAFIRSIYVNDNRILETTFEEIKHIAASQTPIGGSIEHKIAKHVADTRERSNSVALSPAQAGSAYGRFTAMISANFKPQHTTSLATVRSYAYQNERENPVKEYRFGTQGQRHNGEARVSPLFKAWLTAEKDRPREPIEGQTRITHVYINNLGLDRKETKPLSLLDRLNPLKQIAWIKALEGSKERALSEKLHDLEPEHDNIAVITLPADKGLMSGSEFKKTGDALAVSSVRQEFLNLALENEKAKTTKDLHISESIRKLLFGNEFKTNQERILNELLDNSFEAMGLDTAATITSAQRQAVWFHFIKFELTNHILTKLKPESVNFSCKDAIDRGGVSSAYYNLMKSITDESPMSRDEFDRALHAAPTMVKARGMNHHTKLIWNAVDTYLAKGNNYHSVSNNPNKAWLIEWRDLTCPHDRVERLLRQRVGEVTRELTKWLTTTTDNKRRSEIMHGIDLVSNIGDQSLLGVSGKRLLLEVVTRTGKLYDPRNTPESIARAPTDDERAKRLADIKENTDRYQLLEKKLSIKYPTMQVILCAMKVALAYVFSLGQAKTWINDGIASIQAATDVERRQTIQRNMSTSALAIRFMHHPSHTVPATNNDGEPPTPKKGA